MSAIKNSSKNLLSSSYRQNTYAIESDICTDGEEFDTVIQAEVHSFVPALKQPKNKKPSKSIR